MALIVMTAGRNCRLSTIMVFMATAATTTMLFQSAALRERRPWLTHQISDSRSLVSEDKQTVNEELFKRRREKAAEACRKHLGYDPDTFDPNITKGEAVNWREFNFQDYTFYDDNFHFLFCTIPKVASTNIKEMLLRLRYQKPALIKDRNPTIQSADMPHIHRLLEIDIIHPNGSPSRMTYHPRIIVVRHPIERLISAWRDKFLFPEPDHPEIKKIAEYIIGNYRRRETLSESIKSDNSPVTLAEFFKFLAEEGTERWMDDVHWRKYVNHCDPCRVSYDYIAHYENLDQELGYIMNVTTGIPNILSSSMPKPANDSFAASTNGDRAVSLQKTYAESDSVSAELLQKVADKYATDFDIFSYT